MQLSLSPSTPGTIYRGIFLHDGLPSSMGDLGPFVFAINLSNLTGVAFSYEDQAPVSINGTMSSSTTFSGQVRSQMGVLSDFSGAIDSTGRINGTYTDVPGSGGSSGTMRGCRTAT